MTQDLILHQNGSIIADETLSSNLPTLTTITHSPSTLPSWLVTAIIENAVQGTATSVNSDLVKKTPGRSKVLVTSFINNESFYVRNCKKNGLDLASIDNFTFIDNFSDLFTRIIPNPADSASAIAKQFKALEESAKGNDIVVIEAPEVLLNATDIDVDVLLTHLLRVNRQCKQLIVVTQKSDMEFLSKLWHRSSLNMSLQPLETGRANDITGSLVVSRGAVGGLEVAEREYIYLVKKDSSVMVYFR